MGKILPLVLLLLVSGCSYFKSDEVMVAPIEKVEMKPLSTPLIPKPRPNIHDKNYTAPYPQHIVAKPAAPTSAAPTPVKTGARTTVTEKRILDIDVTRGAVSTEEFLGKKKKDIFNLEPKDVEISVEEYETGVLGKAMKLPPKEIEEGKYRTFRRVEDDIAHDTRKIRGKIAQFLFPEMDEVVEKPQGKPQPEVFCYKSLANSTCYSQPLEGQEFRRVGKIDDRFR